MWQVLEVSRSGYCDWCGRGECRRRMGDKVLIKQIRLIFILGWLLGGQ